MLPLDASAARQARSKKQLNLLLTASLVFAGVCCLAVGSTWVILSAQGGFLGLSGSVCVGATTQPYLRVGVAWCSPISSYLPSLMLSPYAVCVDVPYQLISLFPKLAGEVLFPP